MQIYSFNENTNELLIKTLRDADHIDACTPSIPLNSVIADTALPALSLNQTYIISGERDNNGYLSVSKNVSLIADFRSVTTYNKETGDESVIDQLGDLPDNVTILPPIPYSEWSESAGQWVEKANAADLKLLDRRKNAGSLNRSQILTEMEVEYGYTKAYLLEKAEQLTGIHKIKVRVAIEEAQAFTLFNEDIWLFFTDTLGIDREKLFKFWENAKNNY